MNFSSRVDILVVKSSHTLFRATEEAEGQIRKLAYIHLGQRKQALHPLPAPLWALGYVWGVQCLEWETELQERP